MTPRSPIPCGRSHVPVLTCPDCSHAATVPEGAGTPKAWCPRCRRLFEAVPVAPEADVPTAALVGTPVPEEPFDFGPQHPSPSDREREDRGRRPDPPEEVTSRRRLTPSQAQQECAGAIQFAVAALCAGVVASFLGVALAFVATFVVAFVTFGACVPLIIPVIVLLIWLPIKQIRAIGAFQEGGLSRKVTDACM